MQLSLLMPGKVRKACFKEGCDEYLSRLAHYVRLNTPDVREEPVTRSTDPLLVKRREAERLLERIPAGAQLICLDEHGEEWTSVALADFLRQHRDRGTKEVAFVIGGPLGLSPELLQRAHRKLALSRMTLPHELARLMLLEQLYRAFTIIQGEPYHNP